MGLEVGRQLAEKGANIVIVARDQDKLSQAIEYIKQGALNPSIQKFHHISADLTLASESVRVIDEVVSWNSGPPDTVWCCAGTSHPTLFIDTPASKLQEQMDSNYFTSAYMAHATMTCWLKPLDQGKGDSNAGIARNSRRRLDAPLATRHLIFTASFLALYSFAGYAPYSPAKAALRSLSETLSQEMALYAASNPNLPHIRLHTLFPATILTEAYEAENRIKHGLTKKLEEDDDGQSPQVVASKSIKGLEKGLELITTDFLTELVKGSMLGGSLRGGFGRIIMDWILACVMGIGMVFVRADFDRKAKAWGRKFGVSEVKSDRV